MADDGVRVRDHGDLIELHFADVERYHGQHSIAGAALGYQVIRAGLEQLFPASVADREEIAIVSGHPGPGFRDAFELVTRAVTRGTYEVDSTRTEGRYNPLADHAYSWTISSTDGRRVDLVLREGLIPFRFFELWSLVGRGVATDADWEELVQVKRKLADQVVASPTADLFVARIVEPAAE